MVDLITGYHGTNREDAEQILKEGFKLSANEYDWLGDGVYFFQDAPHRAWEWVEEHFGTKAAVIGARIGVENCSELLDVDWASRFTEMYDKFLKFYKEKGLELPVQLGGAHRLNREVINYAVRELAEKGIHIGVVRAPFIE